MHSRRRVDSFTSQTCSFDLEFHFSARILHRNHRRNDPLSICGVFPPPNKATSHRHSKQRNETADPLDFVFHWIHKRSESVETLIESSNSLIDRFHPFFPRCLCRCVGGFERRSLLHKSVNRSYVWLLLEGLFCCGFECETVWWRHSIMRRSTWSLSCSLFIWIIPLVRRMWLSFFAYYEDAVCSMWSKFDRWQHEDGQAISLCFVERLVWVDLLRAWREYSPTSPFGTVWIRFVMDVEYHGDYAILRDCVCSIVFTVVPSEERSEYSNFRGKRRNEGREWEFEWNDWREWEFEWTQQRIEFWKSRKRHEFISLIWR